MSPAAVQVIQLRYLSPTVHRFTSPYMIATASTVGRLNQSTDQMSIYYPLYILYLNPESCNFYPYPTGLTAKCFLSWYLYEQLWLTSEPKKTVPSRKANIRVQLTDEAKIKSMVEKQRSSQVSSIEICVLYQPDMEINITIVPLTFLALLNLLKGKSRR